MLQAAIRQIEVHFPESVLDNQALSLLFEDWTAEKIQQKTGIRQRHVAGPGECASDLATAACAKVLEGGLVSAQDIDFLLLCTQSPDYLLPTTACLVQDRLGLPTTCGALDFNLGCSGFVYGLGLAKGLVETGQARNVLLVTAETYSRHIHPQDRSVRTLFGDAAAAVLVSAVPASAPAIGPFLYGTDGKGAGNLMVPTGGMRRARVAEAEEMTDENGNVRTINNLYMNGAEIFSFTLRSIPPLVKGLLEKAGTTMEQVDLFVFHQANEFLLEALRKKIGIPKEKLPVCMADCGNTVSSTIPIALKTLEQEGRLVRGMQLMLVGFGVGYSWGATMVRY